MNLCAARWQTEVVKRACSFRIEWHLPLGDFLVISLRENHRAMVVANNTAERHTVHAVCAN
jgi:hypothetical protein